MFRAGGGDILTLRHHSEVAVAGGGESITTGDLPGDEWVPQNIWISAPHRDCPTDHRWWVADVTV
jgi:hypothetical protein